MRVVLADPPAYTPPYDHALAAALGVAGCDVELHTSRFRYGSVPQPLGYRRREVFYPLSSRLRDSRARLAVKGLEHPLALAQLNLARPDVLHLQWLGLPELDTWLLRPRAPLVFTAHDLLPRRTAGLRATWLRLFRRFDRTIAHSENGRRKLIDFGVPPERVRVIPHPVFHSDPPRRDDGRTALVLGILRPYKGLADSISAVTQIPDARLIVAGDPREPLDGHQAAGGDRVDWRLGYFSGDELEHALSETTVALFPYRAELDQSGALLQALGAGVPAVVYDVGGLGEVVAAHGAGRVVRAGDLAGFTAALRELLDHPDALAEARAGALAARAELTWERSAGAHLELYAELT